MADWGIKHDNRLLSFSGTMIPYMGAQGSGNFCWVDDDSMWAIRFAREDDAIRTLAAIRTVFFSVPMRDVLSGFRPGDVLRAVELGPV